MIIKGRLKRVGPHQDVIYDEFPASLRHGSVNEAVSGAQGLKGMTKVFLERILSSSASPSTTFRSKAIRALGLVVAKDPNVFFKDSVRSAIENRMLDSSPPVRDATIELLGNSSSPFDPGLAGSLIMKIATSFCDLPSPLESVMKFMFNQNGKKGQSFLETFVVRCREIVDHLIDQTHGCCCHVARLRLSKRASIGTIFAQNISACALEAPKSSGTFGQQLQNSLLVLVNKPNFNVGGTLEANTEKPKLKPLPLLMHLVSTLAAYGDFEQIPSNYKDVREGFRAISEQPMHLYVYKILVQIYHNEHVTKLRGVAIICLVNAITEVELQHRLIKVIAEFIEGQAEQLGLKNELDDATGVDMGQLIGNCEGFEDSGPTTDSKNSVRHHSYTVKARTCASFGAFGLHRLLHRPTCQPGSQSISSDYGTSLRVPFNPGAGKPPASGYVADPPRSVMGPWYQLLSEKRVWKIEFLKAIVKKFYIDPQNANVDLRSVLFARYLAEGLLTLDFKLRKRQYAYQTLQLLEGDQKKSLLELLEDEEGGDTKNKYNFNLIGYRVCVALGIAFVLRDLLKDAFGISDKKALKFMVEFEKTKNKKVRETPAHRKISLKELCLKFDQYLKLKIPGLSGDEETFQLQARAFANMVREDFDVKDSGEHGMLDEESGQEEQDDSEDGADGDDGNMQID
ncbi:hypothetical protein BY996DRAFT_8534661 [Phakopsora pachyrhizi]|nr:hypothetical protein BY996DRAFT_8534661 [Phakopsora pachyrhizi]